VFEGVVIRKRGRGPGASFTVRRVTHEVGVERTFLLNSPVVEAVQTTRRGAVRRARLYYLRGLSGRAARIKELNPAQRRRAAEAQAAAAARREEAARAVAEAEAQEQAAAEAEELAEAEAAEAETVVEVEEAAGSDESGADASEQTEE
jgi:hypothetical protein